MNPVIEYVNDHTESINTIVKWHLERWQDIMPNHTPDSYEKYVSSHYRRGGIPAMFVAVAENRVIGTAALEDDDMDTHPALSPWLANLYVDVKYRKNGIGEMLVHRVIEEARSTGVKKLYLFTPDREHYFSRYGWRTLFKENYYGNLESVMVLDISPSTPSR